MSITTLIEMQVECNLWANTELIQLCATLDEAQLAVEILGTYGRIQPTIAHVVEAEGNYVGDLGGAALWPKETVWDELTFAQPLERAERSGLARLEAAKSKSPDAACQFVNEGERVRFPAWTVINYGIEHRAQVRLLLTKIGVEHPGQSVSGFSASIGALTSESIG